MNLLPLALLLAIAPAQMEVWVTPPRPTVGDPITLTFPEANGRVEIAQSEAYEIVRTEENRAVIRSFQPGPLEVAARLSAGEREILVPSLGIEIVSTLEEGDTLQPAPVRPPEPLPANRDAWIALGLAGAAMIVLWALVYMRRPRPVSVPVRVRVAPSRELLRALQAAAALPPVESRIAIGDATRNFLSRVDEAWGRELTSRELRRALRRALVREELRGVVDTILIEADLEKFSTHGAPEIETRELVESARKLAALDRGGKEA
ncbi:MAG: hypothetical protein LC732_08565 [Acidobacteria bacterium]|nr:hypothetical protein [Acidobacteriota bacterium]